MKKYKIEFNEDQLELILTCTSCYLQSILDLDNDDLDEIRVRALKDLDEHIYDSVDDQL